jgi:predicted kinase
MEAVVFSGVQGSGKSTFYRERFFATHVRLNLDMLRTRNRADILLHACLAAQQQFVVDNTNPTRRQRERYARLAAAAGFSAVLYYFESTSADALSRNAARPEPFRVPDLAILGTLAKFERPSPGEGFGRIYRVRVVDAVAGTGNVGGFDLQEWADEI